MFQSLRIILPRVLLGCFVQVSHDWRARNLRLLLRWIEEAFFFLPAFLSSKLSPGQVLELSWALLSPSLSISTWASFSLLSASLPITLFVPSSPLELKFSGFTARRVFRSVLEVKPAGRPILLPATSPWRVWDRNFVLFVHKPRQNVCSTRDPDSPRRPPFCYAKNAWLCVSVVHAEKILVIWLLLPNPFLWVHLKVTWEALPME